jgi:hypothetical protein
MLLERLFGGLEDTDHAEACSPIVERLHPILDAVKKIAGLDL